MGFMHIIVMMVISIMLVALYFIIRIHNRVSLVSDEKDFIESFEDFITDHIERLGVAFPPVWYFRLMFIIPIVLTMVIYFGTGSGSFSAIVGILGFFGPELIVQVMAQEHRKKFEERYATSLKQLCASLRAGLSVPQAVRDVADCKFLHESMRMQYAKLSSDLQMGLTISEAFTRFADSTKSNDARDVALAISIQNEVGGHEAEVIEEISTNIYDRLMLRKEVKTIFAETSSNVYVFDVLAPLIMLFVTFTNQQYIDTYFSSPIMIAVFAALFGTPFIGSLINHRILAKSKKGE